MPPPVSMRVADDAIQLETGTDCGLLDGGAGNSDASNSQLAETEGKRHGSYRCRTPERDDDRHQEYGNHQVDGSRARVFREMGCDIRQLSERTRTLYHEYDYSRFGSTLSAAPLQCPDSMSWSLVHTAGRAYTWYAAGYAGTGLKHHLPNKQNHQGYTGHIQVACSHGACGRGRDRSKRADHADSG